MLAVEALRRLRPPATRSRARPRRSRQPWSPPGRIGKPARRVSNRAALAQYAAARNALHRQTRLRRRDLAIQLGQLLRMFGQRRLDQRLFVSVVPDEALLVRNPVEVGEER